jgi:hypothetical protein
MKMDHNLAAVMLLGLSAGMMAGPELGRVPGLDDLVIDTRRKRSFRVDRYQLPTSWAHKNRLHTERAPTGSTAEVTRIQEGAERRAAKLARRAARAFK